MRQDNDNIRTHGITLQHLVADICAYTGESEGGILYKLRGIFSILTSEILIALKEDTHLDKDVTIAATVLASNYLPSIYDELTNEILATINDHTTTNVDQNAQAPETLRDIYIVIPDNNDDINVPLGLYRIDLNVITDYLSIFNYPIPNSLPMHVGATPPTLCIKDKLQDEMNKRAAIMSKENKKWTKQSIANAILNDPEFKHITGHMELATVLRLTKRPKLVPE